MLKMAMRAVAGHLRQDMDICAARQEHLPAASEALSWVMRYLRATELGRVHVQRRCLTQCTWLQPHADRGIHAVRDLAANLAREEAVNDLRQIQAAAEIARTIRIIFVIADSTGWSS